MEITYLSNPWVEYLTATKRISILVCVGHRNETCRNLIRRHRIIVKQNNTSVIPGW